MHIRIWYLLILDTPLCIFFLSWRVHDFLMLSSYLVSIGWNWRYFFKLQESFLQVYATESSCGCHWDLQSAKCREEIQDDQTCCLLRDFHHSNLQVSIFSQLSAHISRLPVKHILLCSCTVESSISNLGVFDHGETYTLLVCETCDNDSSQNNTNSL